MPTNSSRWQNLWQNWRFTALLAALVIYILIVPAIASIETSEGGAVGGVITLVAFTIMMATTVFAVELRRFWVWVITLTAIPTLGAAWIELGADSAALRTISFVLSVLFLSMVFVATLSHVFRKRIITVDVISAALCAYLFLGLAWSSGFAVIEAIQPGSFHINDDGLVNEEGESAEFHSDAIGPSVRRIYFSFVTLLTLGYGDIVPVKSLARLSAVMEAFCGQIFMVVLVARLVGVHVAQDLSRSRPHPADDSENLGDRRLL